MPVYRLTASSIISSFRASGKRHLLLTGGRGTGKTTLLRALVPLLCPGAQEITTAAYPADRVEIRESVGGKIAVIGRFDPALPPGENRMRPVADGFLLLGVPALHRMAAGESEWAVLDELGYLENSCPEFRQAVEALLDAKRVLAIVRKQDTPFLTALCARQDAFVVDLDDPASALGCVVMASGLGRRFGGNKLMADFCGAPLIANALALAALPLLACRIVVTRSEEVEALCNAQGVPVLRHAQPYRSDTVRLGLAALLGKEPALRGCLFLPGDQPLLTQEGLLTWASNAITGAMSLNFLEWREKLESIRPHFEDEAFKSFLASLKSSGILEMIQEKRLSASAVATRAPVIIASGLVGGRATWKIEFPLIVSYESSQGVESTQKLLATVLVCRASTAKTPRGVVIQQVVLKRDS